MISCESGDLPIYNLHSSVNKISRSIYETHQIFNFEEDLGFLFVQQKKGLNTLRKIVLIIGGARSGKSSFAEKVAEKIGNNNVTYLATAEALDDEMKERIAHHQSRRPDSWDTVEEPIKVSKALEKIEDKQTVLIDCITLLVTNLLLEFDNTDQKVSLEDDYAKEEHILDEIKNIMNTAKQKQLNLILVSNIVGLGLVPEYKLGRLFRDISGRVNQYLAQKSDKVIFTVAGIPIELDQLKDKDILDKFGDI
jgi:adenosylcobinamide kinase/adenosylcobinamide-phosphate guanylyltransferase